MEEVMDLQKLIDSMSAMSRNTRADYHLTLGGLIAALKKVPPETPVEFDGSFEAYAYPGSEHSYRGYYSDLSLTPDLEPCTAGKLLARMESALDATYEGYKGGDFVMDADTPLWCANYGDCGLAIIAAEHSEGTLRLKCKDTTHD